MKFSDIPGVEKSKKYLRDLVASDRVPHAMIFAGPNGNSKLALAIAYANYLQCTNKSTDACGTCPACIKSQKFVHPDIHFVFPVVKLEQKKREDTVSTDFYPQWRNFLEHSVYGSLTDWLRQIGAEDKVSNINTKECNEISHKLGLKSFEGDYKILIIWYAESLGRDGNRLLKLIEEPPEDTIILLVSERTDLIIKTILSRCQLLAIPPFTDEEIISGLGDGGADKLKELIYLADGNLHLAKSLQSGDGQNYSEELMDWMRSAYQMKPEVIGNLVSEFAKKAKQEQINFLSYGLYYMKEYRKALVSQDVDMAKLSEPEKDIAIKMSNLIDEDMSREIVDLLQKSLYHLSRNANARILFMDITIRLERLMKVTPEVA